MFSHLEALKLEKKPLLYLCSLAYYFYTLAAILYRHKLF